jgi:hypothetical protein
MDLLKAEFGIMELAAIWLVEKIEVYRNGEPIKTVRLTKGDKVRVENNQLMREGLPTYNVVKCLGNLSSTILMVEVEHVLTKETLMIRL